MTELFSADGWLNTAIVSVNGFLWSLYACGRGLLW